MDILVELGHEMSRCLCKFYAWILMNHIFSEVFEASDLKYDPFPFYSQIYIVRKYYVRDMLFTKLNNWPFTSYTEPKQFI